MKPRIFVTVDSGLVTGVFASEEHKDACEVYTLDFDDADGPGFNDVRAVKQEIVDIEKSEGIREILTKQFGSQEAQVVLLVQQLIKRLGDYESSFDALAEEMGRNGDLSGFERIEDYLESGKQSPLADSLALLMGVLSLASTTIYHRLVEEASQE